MIRLNLCDHSDTYMLIKGTIAVPNTVATAGPNNREKKVIIKNNAPFINCISEINNTHVDDAHDTDVVMFMDNLVEDGDTYSKSSGILWQY